MLTGDTNVMNGGTGWPPDDLTPRQYKVLCIVDDHGSECWGDVWSHCDYLRWGVRGTELSNFDRTATALVRKGAIREGDRLEITEWGRQILNARAQEAK
jgi:hypothetical protein